LFSFADFKRIVFISKKIRLQSYDRIYECSLTAEHFLKVYDQIDDDEETQNFNIMRRGGKLCKFSNRIPNYIMLYREDIEE